MASGYTEPGTHTSTSMRWLLLALAGHLTATASAQTLAADPSFSATQSAATGYQTVHDATLDGKDRLVLLLTDGSLGIPVGLRLSRVDVNGGIDPTFRKDVSGLLPQSYFGHDGAVAAVDGDNVVVVGSAFVGPYAGGAPSGPRRAFVGRFGEDGSPDVSYGPDGLRLLALPFSPSVHAAVVEGERTYAAVRDEDASTCTIVALLPGGLVDPAFALNGVATLSAPAECTPQDLITIDGNLLLLGTLTDGRSIVWGVRATGQTWNGFGSSGIATLTIQGQTLQLTQAVLWQGGIAVAGRTSSGVVTAHLTATGAVDTSFGNRSGIDWQQTPLSLTASEDPHPSGLTVSGKTLVSATPARVVTPSPSPFGGDDRAYGFLTTVFDASGARLDQGGPDGFGFLPVAVSTPGNRETPLLTTVLDTDSQGRVVATASRVVSGSGINASEVSRYLLVAPVAADGRPDDATQALSVAPNPVASSACVTLRLEAPAEARVTVLDALGRTVAVLADGPLGAGEHALRLEAAGLPASVYAVVARVGGEQTVRRVTVVR